jgi:hypothetical protein
MSKHISLLLFTLLLVGCAATGKYVEPRGDLDRSLYYREKDVRGNPHEISSAEPGALKTTPTRVPQPALVDRNSMIEIIVLKEHFAKRELTPDQLKTSTELLLQKQRVTNALGLLDEVVQARQRAIEAYRTGGLAEFTQAKKDAATIERSLLSKLTNIWPDGTDEYYRLEEVYDPPHFSALQGFLQEKIAAIEAADSEFSRQVKNRRRELSLEAFLNSPGKETVAIHLEGYDLIQEGTLQRHDRFGLALSAEEKQRLNTQVKATQDLAAALERLRRNEATLNETVREIRTSLAPHIAEIIEDAEDLVRRLDSAKLKERQKETGRLFEAYLDAVEEQNQDLFRQKIDDLKQERDKFLTNLPSEAAQFAEAVRTLIEDAKELKQNWEKATPATLVQLVADTAKAATRFDQLTVRLPEMAADAHRTAAAVLEKAAAGVGAAERDILLNIPEAHALRNDLATYFVDFKTASRLVAKIAVVLQGAEIKPVAAIPDASLPFRVPVEDVKNTFFNIEKTPRLPGDSITIKGTLYSGEEEIIDTSSAEFLVEKLGYYAELSPAVVLIKPDELEGGDDGFRFAPVLSWMHHWAPRPEESGVFNDFSRAFDPALGIHSAFTNFNSDTSDDSIQIGLGATLSFWNNRLQGGVGYNLMADSTDQGRYYYFIGSDLIGILQTMGIVNR